MEYISIDDKEKLLELAKAKFENGESIIIEPPKAEIKGGYGSILNENGEYENGRKN